MSKLDAATVQEILHHDNTTEELLAMYKTWSKTYDADVKSGYGYDAPSKAAKLLTETMTASGRDSNARILDMGSGTGMVGEALYKLGYNNIDALDMSQDCLDVAEEKKVYKNLIRGFMMSENFQDLGVKGNEYDAVVCIGVFTVGHVTGKGFEDLVHVIKPGGVACFSIREDVHDVSKYSFKEKMEELSQKKKWKLVLKVHEIYFTQSNMGAWLYIYEKL